MKSKLIKSLLIILVMSGTWIFSGCEDLLDEPVISKVSSEYYDSENGINALINSMYGRMRWQGTGTVQSFLRMNQYGTDTWWGVAANNNTAYQSYDNYSSALNSLDEGTIKPFWEVNYRMLYSTNIAITNLPSVKRETVYLKDADFNQAFGEAYFFRAYTLLLLVEQFGAIPMPLEATDEVSDEIKRAPASEVYKQIISDFTKAQSLMKNFNTVEYGRLSKQAAQHYLAKAYLERASAVSTAEKARRGTLATDADSAAFYADQVINSNLFTLETNFSKVYDFSNAYSMTPDRSAQSSKERIWVIKYTKTFDLNGFGDDPNGFMSNESTYPIDRGNENARFAWCASGYQKVNFDGLGTSRHYLLGRWVYTNPTPHCFDVFGYSPTTHDGVNAGLNTPADNNRYDSRMYKTFRFTYFAWKQASSYTWQNSDPSNNNTYNWGLDAQFVPGQQRFLQNDTCVSLTPERLSLNDLKNKYKKRYHVFSLKQAEDYGQVRVEDLTAYIPPLIKFADNERYNSTATFDNNASATRSTKDIVLARLAETYLIAGEAYARAGKYGLAVARTNVVRERAAWKNGEKRPWQVMEVHGGPSTGDMSANMRIVESDINTIDKTVAFFLDERERELSGEMNRWVDLTRCEKLLDYVSKFHPRNDTKTNVVTGSGKYNLRPIPQSHIDRLRNPGPPSEEQNPGYF